MQELKQLIKQMRAGQKRALARIISFIEDRDDSLPEIIKQLYPLTGHAQVLGITGPPGAGKSTVTDKLVGEIRKIGKKVAVIAVDPSSPFSGGALLGDRIRMQSHLGDPNVYIRSLGTRGKHGGLSQSSKEVVMALDAAGFDWIIVETAGVGQTELDILKLAHAVCVVLVPESGDGIQVMKAGLMEIADLFVVNKSDRPEADKLVRELVTMIGMSGEEGVKPTSNWNIPVVKTQALFDRGINELFVAIQNYFSHAIKHGALDRKRRVFIEEEVVEIILNKIDKEIREVFIDSSHHDLILKLVKKQENPYDAANKLLRTIVDKKILK